MSQRIKTDLTPVTAADEASEAIILEGVSTPAAGRPGDGRGKRRPQAAASTRTAASSSSIHSTAPRNFSPAATNTRSMSASSQTGFQSPASSRRRHKACCGAALPGGRRRKARDCGWPPAGPRPHGGAFVHTRAGPGPRHHRDLAQPSRRRDRGVPGTDAGRQALSLRLVDQILPACAKATPIFIRGCRRRANGISRPATPFSLAAGGAVTDRQTVASFEFGRCDRAISRSRLHRLGRPGVRRYG